ncbi:MAG: LysM peptidoglycan-binding domain-containing protein [Flavobacteriales bacterium]
MKRTLIILSMLLAGAGANAALQKDTLPPGTPELPVKNDDPEVQAIDKMLVTAYLNHFCFSSDQQVLNAYGYAPEQVPTFSTDVVAQRMAILDKDTPFDLVYNSTVQGFVDLYSVRRRDITSRVLGMSQLYFPIFEEYLAKYDIPMEMKYLAIVESALHPTAISSAGAGGLWQFMVGTGKMYGLDVTSYQDDRFDAYKSTEAACKYLKFLYNTFGDWQLALAAYNSGPGNVNKAIRRSGGKKDFWSIKPFLPKETQGYVPAFIAVNYVMNYATEYNIYPKQPLTTYFETDSVRVKERVDFASLSKVVGMPVEDIAFLNGTYKLKEIPNNGRLHYLILPVEKVGLFMANESLVYEQSKVRMPEPEPVLVAENKTGTPTSGKTQVVWEETWKTHKVRRGESLGSIANKYDCTLAELKKWNRIKGSVIHAGDNLKIQQKVKRTVVVEEENVAEKPAEKTSQQEATAENKEVSNPEEEPSKATVRSNGTTERSNERASAPVKYKYYTIQPGDTLYKIASKYDGVTVNSLKNLNSGLRENKLVVGQKIKIKQI